MLKLVVLQLLLASASLCSDELVNKRHEYRYSIHPPHTPDPGQQIPRIPFWSRSSDVIVSRGNVRLTPNLVNWKGSIWHKNQTSFEWWEVELVLYFSGRGRYGGEGMVFWYTDTTGEYNRKDFGGPDLWNGLGIFFDSFDQDQKQNNPAIIAIVNNGTFTYDYKKDGLSQETASCLKDYRNTPFPLRVRIRLYKDVLTLHQNGGMNRGESDADFDLCFRAENLDLPKFGYFGISAATGDIVDNHDILKLSSYSLTERNAASNSTELGDNVDPEQEKYDKEFKEHEEHFKQQKEEYKQEHPEESNHTKDGSHEETDDDELYYEDVYEKQLAAIFQEQSLTRHDLQALLTQAGEELMDQLDSLTVSLNNYQESVISRASNGTVAVEKEDFPRRNSNPNAVIGRDIIERYEVQNLLMANRELLNVNTEIKGLLSILSGIIDTGIQHQTKSKSVLSGVQSSANVLPDMVAEVNTLQNEIYKMSVQLAENAQKQSNENKPKCSTFCVNTQAYIVFSIASTGLILAVLIYNDSKKSAVGRYY